MWRHIGGDSPQSGTDLLLALAALPFNKLPLVLSWGSAHTSICLFSSSTVSEPKPWRCWVFFKVKKHLEPWWGARPTLKDEDLETMWQWGVWPDEGARGLDAVDDGVLVVGEEPRSQNLHRIHRQLHHLLRGERVRRRLTGQHGGGQAGGWGQREGQRGGGDHRGRGKQGTHCCLSLHTGGLCLKLNLCNWLELVKQTIPEWVLMERSGNRTREKNGAEVKE